MAETELFKQPITLHVKNKTLPEILAAIELQSAVRFNYSQKIMPQGLYSLKVKSEPLETVLSHLLSKHHLAYAIMYGQSVVITALPKNAKRYIISGYVTDEISGEKLIGVSVTSRLGNETALSNADGFYSLSLPSDSVYLSFHLNGYQVAQQPVFLNQNLQLNVALKDDYTLYKYTYTLKLDPQSKLQTEGFHLNAKVLKQLPVLFGESDLMKGLQLLPGVSAGNDGTIGVNVRGGSADQNLILLDDVPLYNPSHIYGFFSVFNSDVVKDVRLIKGGMNARYGGRLSSVLDVKTTDGNKNRIKVQASIGLITSKLSIDGPINASKKTTFVVSARRSYIDVLRGALNAIPNQSDLNPFKTGYYFYDINAKIKHDFSRKHQLSLSYYLGQDIVFVKNAYSAKVAEFSVRQKDRQNVYWGNQLIALRDHHIWSQRLSAWLSVANTTYRFGNAFEYSYSKTSDTSSVKIGNSSSNNTYVNSLMSQYHLEYLLSPNTKLTAGISYTNHWFRNSATYQDSINLNASTTAKNLFANELSGYLNFNTNIRQKFQLEAGLMAVDFISDNTQIPSLQPRLNCQFKPYKPLILHAAFQSTAQFLHMVSSNNIGLPVDVWLPSNSNLKPELSQQLSGGLSCHFPQYVISLDAFNKRMNNLIDFVQTGANASSVINSPDAISVGKGWAYGYECMLEKKTGKFNGWMSYTLSWNQRQFPDINQGQVFPYRYDRRHNFACLVNYQASKRFEAAMTWTLATGARYTIPEQVYFTQNGLKQWEQIYLYGQRNNYQFPYYHRLDLTLTFKKYHKHYTRLLSIGAYNVYNRFNPFYIQAASNKTGTAVFEAVSLFPCIPSVFYKWQF